MRMFSQFFTKKDSECKNVALNLCVKLFSFISWKYVKNTEVLKVVCLLACSLINTYVVNRSGKYFFCFDWLLCTNTKLKYELFSWDSSSVTKRADCIFSKCEKTDKMSGPGGLKYPFKKMRNYFSIVCFSFVDISSYLSVCFWRSSRVMVSTEAAEAESVNSKFWAYHWLSRQACIHNTV